MEEDSVDHTSYVSAQHDPRISTPSSFFCAARFFLCNSDSNSCFVNISSDLNDRRHTQHMNLDADCFFVVVVEASASTSRVSVTFPSPAEYVSTCPVFHVLPEPVPPDVQCFLNLNLTISTFLKTRLSLSSLSLKSKCFDFSSVSSPHLPHCLCYEDCDLDFVIGPRIFLLPYSLIP